ncbi:hypothetical protein [Agrobacterium rubi]|uniref:Uncharacterized protein n=1 Tax=Agrobacterium rubi TaxID=28099 RepID=A0AAE7UUB0_9HYPH|nr:hypothetical protein [Agrobacterium rubi]NTE89604.1 hypothetical protein [Agrobacterium rubi]NTF05546.1 hypothetical protein [Agrobacterium rubi]NTF39986.1 hypothetical protein [Agrobacterium rubi]OCJ44719.1 hypothetical protein A6U92_15800 [Agrobacterium rubi]QTG03820.1 hypothetical protein G6M88_25560 [Agrobacterium rubi]
MADVGHIDRPPFGRLGYGKQYGAEYWRGSLSLPGFGQPFSLIVRAGLGGPSARQAAAVTAVVLNVSSLREQATQPMAELHKQAGLPLFGEDKNVWSFVQPEEIDVSDEGYYRDGRILVALIFGSMSEPAFAPAIETADGHFVQVLSGA